MANEIEVVVVVTSEAVVAAVVVDIWTSVGVDSECRGVATSVAMLEAVVVVPVVVLLGKS